MRFINYVSLYITALGHWSYALIFLVALLESTAFVGLLVPGTTFAIFSGFLASQKIIDVGDVIWIMTLGGVLGDMVSYFLGTRGTTWFKNDNRLIKKTYLENGRAFFDRHGYKSVVLARFVGPFRPVVPFVAGVVKMPKLNFLFFNVLGGIISSTIYVLLGYFFGSAWAKAAHVLGRFGMGAVVLVLLVFLVGFLFDTYVVKKTK